MPTILKIKHEDWETMADASLVGMLVEKGLAENIEDKEIILEIEQTSLKYRAEHNGPEMLIIPEYTPMCVIQSVISLMESGYKISVLEVMKE